MMALLSKTVARSEGLDWALQNWGVKAMSPDSPLRTVPDQRISQDELKPVSVRADLGYANIRALHAPGTSPVVVRGAACEWEACRTWSLDSFAERFGDHLVPTDDRDAEGNTVTQSLAECVAATRRGEGGYARFSPLMAEYPELVNDLDLPALMAMSGGSAKRALFQLFIGGAGTTTETHCAVGNNAFVQVHGTKDWWFVPPSYTAALNPLPFGRPYFASRATLHDPSLDTHPDAPVFRVRLEPGDVMLIPPFWWHQVANPTESIGLATRWHHLGQAFSQSAFLSLMTLTAMHPNIVKANKDRRRFGYVYQETLDQANGLLAETSTPSDLVPGR